MINTRFFLTKISLTYKKETYGVEFAPLIINLDEGRNVDIQICDAGGGETSRTMAMSIIKTCPLVIVVYDITSKKHRFWIYIRVFRSSFF